MGNSSLTCLGHMNHGVQSVWCAAAWGTGVVYPSKAERQMKDRVIWPECIVYVQNGIWAGTALIG